MKIIKFLSVFILLMNIACKSKFEMNERDRIADHMILEFAETVATKGLRPMGIGGGLNHETGKHKLFSIVFTTQEEVKGVAHARVLFVETADAFLDFINSREDIREYLDIFPVTITNINLGIICSNAQSGNIVNISNCEECLYYDIKTTDSYKDPWEKVHEETFEEAHQRLLYYK